MQNQESQLKRRKTVGKILQSICTYKGKNKGLTLIEVVISLAIFSLLAIPVSGFVNSSIKMNKKSEVKQQATLLGQSILEELASVDKLVVGMNQLFGKSDVEILESDSCEGSQYCIKEVELQEFYIDIDFNDLGIEQGNRLLIETNASTPEKELFILVENKNIMGQIKNKQESKIDKQDKDELIITIDGNRKVLISNNRESKYLEGTLTIGNLLIEFHNNNQSHGLSKVKINNSSDLAIYGCISNKDAGGHIQITEDKIEAVGKVDIQVLEGEAVCKFSISEGDESGDDNNGNIIPPQATDSLDLFEVQLKVYKPDSTDLLFKGTRVVPLKFE